MGRRTVWTSLAGVVSGAAALWGVTTALPAGAVTGPAVETTITIPTASDCASQSTGPFKVAMSSDGLYTYATLNGDGRVAKLENATNTVVGTACTGARYPEGLAVSADGTRLYVTNGASSNLRIINTADMTTVKDLDVGGSSDGVDVVTVPAAIGKVYVFRHTEASIVVVQTSDNTVVKTFSVGTSLARRAQGIVASPDGSKLYALVNEGVAVIDTATDSVSGTITLSDTTGIAMAPDGLSLYVIGGAGDNSLRRVRLSDNSVVSTVTVGSGPRAIVITPDGKHALVILNPSNVVVAVDLVANAVTHTVAVPPSPYGAAMAPNGLFAIVANWGGGYGDSLSRLSLAWPTTLPPTGSNPDWVVVVGMLLLVLGAVAFGFGGRRSRAPVSSQ